MIENTLNFNTKLSFENGLTISFSIGEGNYCSNKNFQDNPYVNKKESRVCKDCEVMVWATKTGEDKDINLFLPKEMPNDGTVIGYVSADELAEIIYNVKNFKK